MNEWVYGNHRNLGWGIAEYDMDSYEITDFQPEWTEERDIEDFQKNKQYILKLKNMNIMKYNFILSEGLRLKKLGALEK